MKHFLSKVMSFLVIH